MWRHRDTERAGPIQHVVDKIGSDILGARDPSPIPHHPAQGSSVRQISPHKFWL